MLTLFAVPKPFRNHVGMIQMNAVQSWFKLAPSCEIILLGEEEGTAQTAARFGATHVPRIARNEFGTPLLNDIFERAQELARHDLLCYVNADIILMDDFIDSVKSLSRRKKPFLMVGRRWNLDVHELLPFERGEWSDGLRKKVAATGVQGSRFYIDYFVFQKGLLKNLPPFTIGRAGFDNWLLWKARACGAAIVDASQAIMAVHQNHDYAHHPEGQSGVYHGVEAKRNKELIGGRHHFFTLEDATHRLTPTGLRRNLGKQYFHRRWKFFRRAVRHAFYQLRARDRNAALSP